MGISLLGCLSFSWNGIVFFRVSAMMLCFDSRRKTMLIIQLFTIVFIVAVQQCCTGPRPFSSKGEQN